jgi:hypothetical protein
MDTRPQKNLVLILAREFASKLGHGHLRHRRYREPRLLQRGGRGALGRAFADAGELTASGGAASFSITDLDGTPIPLEEIPGGVALLERRPAHRALRFTALDGIPREVSVTGLPLLSHADELVGSVSLFWQLASDERPG